MDAPPPEPPAIIYEEPQTLEQKVQSPFIDEQYLSQTCENWHWLIRRFVKHAVIRDDYNANQQLKNKQVLYVSNHKSHFDYLQQMYDFWKFGYPLPRILGRENVFIPHLGKVWKKCGAIEIPFNSSDRKSIRELRDTTHKTIEAGGSLLDYPGAGRNYEDQIGEFNKKGMIEFAFQAARRLGIDLQVEPLYITYRPYPIEKRFFPLLKKLKGRFFNIPYIATDLVAFALAGIKPSGLVFHALGEPFNILDCKNKHEVTEEARNRIIQMEKQYYDRLASWPPYGIT